MFNLRFYEFDTCFPTEKKYIQLLKQFQDI